MKKVLIISISRDEQTKLEEAVKTHRERELVFETTASFGQDASWWAQNSPECLILSLPADDIMQGYFLTKLRVDVPRSLPLLVLCDSISANLMQLSQIFSKVRMIKVPVKGGDLLRAVIDVTTHFSPGQQQAHPRYLTDQQVTISSDVKEGRHLAMMKNLSLSGAYFESDNPNLGHKTGDLIKISVTLGAPASSKEYTFDAKIVWVKPLDANAGNGYGITFVDKDEVYNNLLKGF